jgi:hypothetical protein
MKDSGPLDFGSDIGLIDEVEKGNNDGMNNLDYEVIGHSHHEALLLSHVTRASCPATRHPGFLPRSHRGTTPATASGYFLQQWELTLKTLIATF